MAVSASHRSEASSAKLIIDLDAIAANYGILRAKVAPAICAAVVKANAYGLGAVPVTRRLLSGGCRHFFVAHPGEGVELRNLRDVALEQSSIYVLGGLSGEPASLFTTYDLVPALPSIGDIELWATHARKLERKLPAVLHFDTGMSRLGIPTGDALMLSPRQLDHFDIHFVMSHLACSDEQANPKNAEQLERFAAIRARHPNIKGSLANSGGIFLGAPFTHDLVRPGAAIYGLAPTAGAPNPMKCVLKLEAPLLQVRHLSKDDTVGYGATFRAGGAMRIATLGVGYADGYPRSLSNRGQVAIGGTRAPIIGRVSMDLTTIDITALPESAARPGTIAELIGPGLPPDEVAQAAGTIGYEILTGLGPRYARIYKGAARKGEV